jgi:hypothetical protein
MNAMKALTCMFFATSMAVLLIASGMPARTLSGREASRVRGLQQEAYDCEECYYGNGTMQCSGISFPFEDMCMLVNFPPVQNQQNCQGKCGFIYCNGNALRGYCSSNYPLGLSLCECTTNGQMQCGTKDIAAGDCTDVWLQPPNNAPLEWGGCDCPNIVPTNVPCMDEDIDHLNTSCPGGGANVFIYPKNFDRFQFLASIR